MNGADWVLERVFCGMQVSGADIAGMGGATAGEVALAAIAPLRDRTRANARRLMGA